MPDWGRRKGDSLLWKRRNLGEAMAASSLLSLSSQWLGKERGEGRKSDKHIQEGSGPAVVGICLRAP